MSFTTPIVSAPPNSENTDWLQLRVTDFSGGMVTDYPDTQLADNQLTNISNYFIDKSNSLVVRPFYQPYYFTTSSSVLTTAPLSFMFTRLSGTQYLFTSRDAGSDTAIEYFKAGTWTTILSSNLTDGYTVEFERVSVNDYDELVICNGIDEPKRWSSSTATDLGLTAPDVTDDGLGAASAKGEEGGRGITENGTYYYKFTFFYDGSSTKYGESGPSAAVSTYITGADDDNPYKVTLSATLPTGVTRAYTYRSPADTENGPYERVGHITGTTYDDHTPVGAEGVEPPDDSSPPRLKHPVWANKRLWGVGQSDSGGLSNKLVWSEADAPDVYLATSVFYTDDDITGIAHFRNNMYVMTIDKVFWLKDSDPNNDFLKVADRGCASHHSIGDIGIGLVWMGKDNIFFFDHNTQAKDGDLPIPICNGMAESISNVLSTRRHQAFAEVYEDKYILSFTGGTNTTNNKTFVWSTHTLPLILSGKLNTAGWSTYDWRSDWMQNFEGTLYHTDNVYKYIMQDRATETGTKDYKTYGGSTVNIQTAISMKRFHFNDVVALKHLGSTIIGADTAQDTLIYSLDIDDGDFADGGSIILSEEAVTSGSYKYDDTASVYGTATYGVSNFKFYHGHKRFRLGTKGRNAKLSLTSVNANQTKIMVLALTYKQEPFRM